MAVVQDNTHSVSTSTVAPKTIAYLTPFPYDEVAGPALDAQRYIYNLQPLMAEIADLAERAEDDAQGLGKLELSQKLERIKRLMWLACEERGRCEDAIFGCEGVISSHIERRAA